MQITAYILIDGIRTRALDLRDLIRAGCKTWVQQLPDSDIRQQIYEMELLLSDTRDELRRHQFEKEWPEIQKRLQREAKGIDDWHYSDHEESV